MGHSKHSPSGASLWMGCAGALNRIKKLGIKDDRTSVHAAEGTAAHWVREQCLEFGFDPHDFLGTKIQADGFDFVVDDAMATALVDGIDRCRELSVPEATTGVELRVDTTPWVGPDDDRKPQGGTVDYFIISSPTYYLEEWVLSDLKYGAGIAVSPVRNKQQKIYGLGLLNSFPDRQPPKRLRIIIDQPRNSAGGGEWVIEIDELLAFGEEVKRAAAATRDPDAPCTPSESACQWCPLTNIDGACPEHEAWKLNLLGLEFDDLDADDEPALPEIDGMTPQRRRYINQHAHLITKWLKRLHAEEIHDVITKGPANGVKAVSGRAPPRKHKDEKASEAWLNKRLKREQIFHQQLISVAQLDKVLGKGVFPKSLVAQGDPKPVLVPVEDERPAIIRETEFDDLDAEDDAFNDDF